MTDLRELRMPEPPLARPTTAGALADRLIATTVDKLMELEASTAPGLVLPRIHAGHVVGDDATSDLLYVMGLLVECGVEQVAGVGLRSHIVSTLGGLDASRVEAFASYRVAETVLRIGGLEAVPVEQHETVLEAATSTKTLAMLEDGADIPPNFAVVGARCLRGVARLRGTDGADDAFVERVRAMFGDGEGWIDDGMGAWVQYDIYTPDVYLFAEPLRDDIGGPWRRGLERVLADLDALAQPGGAVVWGRSVGALGLAMTIELAGLSVGHGVGDAHGRWIARATAALDELRHRWFPAGVIAAHQGRATMFYRGPHRRLQMTLDVYGKLLLAALGLRRRPEVPGAPPAAAWPPVDRLITFDPARHAAVWAVRRPSLRWALPLLTGFSTDYAPSPRAPGLFEQPTSGHPVMQPVITGAPRSPLDGDDAVTLVPAGLPSSVEHEPGRLTVTHEGWAPCGSGAEHPAAIAGARSATYRVEGRTLAVDETLTFDTDELPGPLSVSVAERAERPLRVAVDGDAGSVRVVDTSGVAEWRSFWGEAARVHQFEIPSARSIRLTWRATPVLRVAGTAHGAQYDRGLYDPIRDRLVVESARIPDGDLVRRLDGTDVLHMAWPEWWAGTDPDRNRAVIEQVRATGTAVVWTQHNLLPHADKSDDARATYQLWAEAADTVIHHTEVGRRVAVDTYRYGADTVHEVIPHGHWGAHLARFAGATREEVEREEGWAPCGLRLAVVGAPRLEKDLQLVVDAVAACSRTDVQLLIRSEDAIQLPDDPRIIAEDRHLSDARYARRLAAFDALVLPFAPRGMLTTGTAFDSIGAGLPAITSDWDFFDETFDGADIRYGTTAQDLTRCIDGLTAEELQRARVATVARQEHFEWGDIAERTLEVLEAAAVRVAERTESSAEREAAR